MSSILEVNTQLIVVDFGGGEGESGCWMVLVGKLAGAGLRYSIL